MATLRATRADTLMVFALPKQTIQALVGADKLGWHPHPYIAAVSIDPFVMNVARFEHRAAARPQARSALTFLKDASNHARWGKDPGVKLYYSILEALRARERPEGGREHLRDGGRVHAGGRARACRQEPDARVAC